MREIKFRAWSPDDKRMTEQEINQLKDDLTRFIHELIDMGTFYPIEAATKTLQAVSGHASLKQLHKLGAVNMAQGLITGSEALPNTASSELAKTDDAK